MRLPTLLLALAPFAAAQDFSDLHIEKFSGGYRFTEGPVWSVKDNVLIFSDVPNNRVVKWVPGVGVQTLRDNSNGVNGNAIDHQGRLISCESRTRRVVRHKKDGEWEVIADKWQGKRFNGPNDVIARKDGHIFFTDPAFGEQLEKRELDFYGVFHITPKGELELTARFKGRPNGIALSPNGRILYVANSDERVIAAFDVDKDGKASNERVFLKDLDGAPGGMRVDEKGNLYVTTNKLTVYSSQGKVLKVLEMSEPPHNLAFGDPDLQTLYITAMSSVYRIRLTVKGLP